MASQAATTHCLESARRVLTAETEPRGQGPGTRRAVPVVAERQGGPYLVSNAKIVAGSLCMMKKNALLFSAPEPDTERFK